MEDTRLQILGQHLSTLQTNLSLYEQKLLTNERSSALKAMVDYYREETKLVGRYLMGLVTVSTSADQKPAPTPAPAPVEVIKPEPASVCTAASPVVEAPAPEPTPEPAPTSDTTPAEEGPVADPF